MNHQMPIVIALFIGLCMIILPENEILAEATDQSDINLELSPDRTLFDVDHMKPGDWAPRTVTVSNAGNKSFDYEVKLDNKSSDKLFKELQLEIQNQNEELYSGKLADFETAQSSLESKEEEDLEMTVRFPAYLGNDFQGVATSFSFLFTAQGEANGQDEAGMDGMVDSGDDGTGGGTSKLPKTATTIFNFLLIGIVILGAGILLAVYHRNRTNRLSQSNNTI